MKLLTNFMTSTARTCNRQFMMSSLVYEHASTHCNLNSSILLLVCKHASFTTRLSADYVPSFSCVAVDNEAARFCRSQLYNWNA